MDWAAAPAVETVGLRKVFGSKVAVDSLTLTVERGEVFGFLGPNGAGKTTAIKMLMGLVQPTAGQARILGRPVTDLSMRRHIGFLPEHFRFHDWLQATEFLDWHGELYGMSPAERRKRIPEVLAAVGLADVPHQRLHTFSKGMLQRIGLAQALLNHPAVVFLDEPTSALDPLGRRDVRDLIKQVKAEGVTVFLNSHLLSEIEMVCDRVAIIDHGRVVSQGRLNDLLASQLEVDLRVEGLSAEGLAALQALSASLSVTGDRLQAAVRQEEDIPRLVEAVVSSGAHLYELTPRRRSLEDLFVRVIEEAER
ncbi:MAG: ABC transporter ATP-binding protein [Chloroflexi bacterium]|nr:ABC transporter ATP-binding protein [Chloroflexota bacterium]